ncbi:MAG: hypothetical protein BRD30_00195 [Bacteroidetes bacterium QH_2_63_10]|nr:MAG: hypothetical protein BRD30_00195 [Bacteroidetes bacterium QH_2_63_10]
MVAPPPLRGRRAGARGRAPWGCLQGWAGSVPGVADAECVGTCRRGPAARRGGPGHLLRPGPRAPRVINETAPLRTAPNETTAPDSTLREGTMVEVQAPQGPWRRVRLGDGTIGWLPADALNEV